VSKDDEVQPQSQTDADETRTRRLIQIPGDHVAEACEFSYSANDGRTVLWAFHYGISQRWTARQFAKKLNVSTAEIYRVFQGNAQDGELDRVLKSTRALQEKVGDGPALYAKTSISRDIEELFKVALRRGEKGTGGLFLVVGMTGIGKSITLKSLCRLNNHGSTQFYPFDNAGGKKHVIYDLAALNNINKSLNYTETTPRVRACYGPRRVRLLVFDELDLTLERRNDPTDITEYLRRLADIQEFSIILAGRFDRFVHNVRRTGYDITQLMRRCKRKLIIPREAPEADVEILFKYRCPDVHYSPAIHTALKAMNSHDFGGFGGVSNIIDNAIDFAQEDCHEELHEKHVLAIAKKEMAALALARSELEPTPPDPGSK
jgi:hypothetical protein